MAGPIPSLAGQLVEAIEQEAGCYRVTALKKAPGVLAEELPYEEWSDVLFQAWGRTAGRMHAIAQACGTQGAAAAEAALGRPEWDQARNYFERSAA